MRLSPQYPGWRLWLPPLMLVWSFATASAALESNLVEKSPFLPPGWGKKAEVPEPVEAPVVKGPLGRELELRGIFEMGGETKFSIFDKTTQRGQWVAVNGGTDRFTVIRFNDDKDSIMIKSGAGTEVLTLANADDTPMDVQGQAPVNFRPPTPPPNFKPPTSPPSGPPSSSPPSTIPPPPPAALLNARNNTDSGGSAPRRRIIRRNTDASSGSSSNASSSGNEPASIPPAPNFTPQLPSNLTPPTSRPPTTTQ